MILQHTCVHNPSFQCHLVCVQDPLVNLHTVEVKHNTLKMWPKSKLVCFKHIITSFSIILPCFHQSLGSCFKANGQSKNVFHILCNQLGWAIIHYCLLSIIRIILWRYDRTVHRIVSSKLLNLSVVYLETNKMSYCFCSESVHFKSFVWWWFIGITINFMWFCIHTNV